MNHSALINALAPFAALAASYEAAPDSQVVLEVSNPKEASINVGHLRQAAHIIQSEGYIDESGALAATDEKWQQLARDGQHIEAVRLCRAAHGLGLIEARSVVERFLDRGVGMSRR